MHVIEEKLPQSLNSLQKNPVEAWLCNKGTTSVVPKMLILKTRASSAASLALRLKPNMAPFSQALKPGCWSQGQLAHLKPDPFKTSSH